MEGVVGVPVGASIMLSNAVGGACTMVIPLAVHNIPKKTVKTIMANKIAPRIILMLKKAQRDLYIL
jgi:hypothetical protein